MERIPLTPRSLTWILRCWPPYVGAGIRVREIARDWSYARVELAHNPLVANANRTAFGGSMQAMTDPFYCLLLMGRLGRDYVVWDTAAEIRFVRPGRTRLRAEMRIDDATVREIERTTADGSKSLTWFSTEIRDAHGEVVAEVRREVYVRRRRDR